jgi:hypothetical protein
MRLSSGLVAFVTLISASAARADEADELVTQGQDFARRGEYARAIETFKAADRIQARASNACMIGLAYLRRNLYPQAEVFLARCRKRASEADPLPEWMTEAESQLSAQLASAPVTAVEIVVQPPGVAASITTSSFAPDETFDPQTIHLPAGPHTITATAPGFVSATQSLTISGTDARRVELVLAPVAKPVVVTPPPPPPPPPVVVVPQPDRRKQWSNRLFIVAGGAAVGGVVLHVLASRTREKLLGTPEEYRANETTFDVERASAISLYAIAGITAGVAIYLRRTHRDVQIGAAPSSGGAMVTIGWSR